VCVRRCIFVDWKTCFTRRVINLIKHISTNSNLVLHRNIQFSSSVNRPVELLYERRVVEMVSCKRCIAINAVQTHHVPVFDVTVFTFHLHVHIFCEQTNTGGEGLKVCGVYIDFLLVNQDEVLLLLDYNVVITPISGPKLLHTSDVFLEVSHYLFNLLFDVLGNNEHLAFELVDGCLQVSLILLLELIDSKVNFLCGVFDLLHDHAVDHFFHFCFELGKKCFLVFFGETVSFCVSRTHPSNLLHCFLSLILSGSRFNFFIYLINSVLLLACVYLQV
jgi:hypothetical protein